MVCARLLVCCELFTCSAGRACWADAMLSCRLACMQALDCDVRLKGQCKLIDISALPAAAQGPALQAQAAEQLLSTPDSLFVFTHPEQFSASGLGIMLQLIGVVNVTSDCSA
jgi:hypothetical protein